MKRLMQLAARVYPRSWRMRYGAEFAALLEKCDGGWRSVGDVAWGAVKMRMRTDFRLLAACGLAGLAVAAMVASQIPNRFRSEAVLRITETGGTGGDLLKDAFVQAESQLSRTSLSSLIQSPDLNLYSEERKRVPLKDVIERMKARDIRIDLRGDHHNRSQVYLKIIYQGESPVAVKKTTQKIVAGFIDSNLRNLGSSQLFEVLDSAGMPRNPIFPNRPLIVLAGLADGLMLGISGSVVRSNYFAKQQSDLAVALFNAYGCD